MTVLTNPEREKLLYHYTMALEHGDLLTVGRILSIAEDDAPLENMILGANSALANEQGGIEPLPTPGEKDIEMPIFSKEKRKHGKSRPTLSSLVAVFVTLLFSGFILVYATQPTLRMMVQGTYIDPTDVIHEYFEAWNNNTPDDLNHLLTTDHIHIESNAFTLAPPDGEVYSVNGIQSVKDRITQLHEAFFDVNLLVTQMKHEDQTWVVSFQLTGHPSGTSSDMIVSNFTAELTFRGDKIASTRMTVNLDHFIRVGHPMDYEGLVSKFFEAWNDDAPFYLEGHLAPTYTHHEPEMEPLTGILEIQRRIAILNTAFDEVHFTVLESLRTDNELWATIELKARQDERLMTSLQNTDYRVEGNAKFEFDGEVIIRSEFSFNLDNFMNAYGLLWNQETFNYIVQEGDTPYSILAQFGLDDSMLAYIEQLNSMNFYDRNAPLQVGAPLILPVVQSTTLPVVEPMEAHEPVKEMIEIPHGVADGLILSIDAGQAHLMVGSFDGALVQAEIENISDYTVIEKGEHIKIVDVANYPISRLVADDERPLWKFKIDNRVRTDLSVTGIFGDVGLDLADVNLIDLKLELHAGVTNLSLPDTGKTYPVRINVIHPDATLKLTYPTQLGLRIVAEDGIWQSRNYNDVMTQIHITLNGSLSVLDMTE